MIKEVCAFFGVECSGTKEQLQKRIKKAYRRRVLACHPDRGGDVVEFRKVQDAYDKFKEYADSFKPQAATRPVTILFESFRDFLCESVQCSREDLLALMHNDEEQDWLAHFVRVSMQARFVTYSEKSHTYRLSFMDKHITLPRFYRAFALAWLAKDDPLFWDIERMFSKQLPWNYSIVKERIAKRRF